MADQEVTINWSVPGWHALTLRQKRGMILNLLLDTGACVFRKEVRGHVVAIVLPGESEVENKDEPAVWETFVDELEVAKQFALKLNSPRS